MGGVVEPVNLDEFRSTEELLNHQKDVKGRIVELHQEFEGLPFPDEARDEFAGLTKTNDEIERRVKELEARKFQLERMAQANPQAVERLDFEANRYFRPSPKEQDIYNLGNREYQEAFDNPDKLRGLYRDNALRAIELAKFPYLGEKRTNNQTTREDIQTHIEHLIDHSQQPAGDVAKHLLITGSPVYRRAYGKFLAGAGLSAEETRALTLGATTGGQAVPFTLDPTVIPTSNSVVNPARALARIETISGSNTWNGVSSGAITATRVAEATAATDNTPTMAAPTLTVTKAHAFVPFSVEIQEDWGALEAEMGKLLSDAKDDDEGTQFVTGAGTTVFPQGFVTGTTNTSAAATGLTVTAANVYALEAALPPRFRGNESFVANRGIYNIVRGIDTAGGAALWLYISQGLVTQAPTPGNTGATLLGRGAWEASAMQATVVNATKIMIVGNFQYFLIVDRIGMNIELIPFLFGAAQGNLPTGQRGLYAWWRNSSKVLSAAAFVAMTGTT
jgi:HK97 family phage major capsid protein